MILVAWMLFGVLMTVYDHLVVHSGNSLGASEGYSFWFSLAMNTGSALIGALLGGSMMVFYINVKYRDKPYGQTILAVAVGYAAVIGFIVLILAAVFVPLRTGKPLSDPVTQEALRQFLSDATRIKKHNDVVRCRGIHTARASGQQQIWSGKLHQHHPWKISDSETGETRLHVSRH
jgi:adenylate cyclase